MHMFKTHLLQARPILAQIDDEDDVDEIADPHLEGNYDPKEMLRMAHAARACVRHSASMRPAMGQVGSLCLSVSRDFQWHYVVHAT